MLRRFIGQGAFFWEIRWIAKSNFRKGGANLPVCLDSRQGIATISEITFGKCSGKIATKQNRPAAFSKKLASLRCACGFLLLALLAALACPASLRAESATQREYEIKAAYLYNFINYIDWPENAFPGPGGTITIGVVGQNPYGTALDVLNGKQIKGRTLALKQITDTKDLDQCQIVFINSSEKSRLPELLEKL